MMLELKKKIQEATDFIRQKTSLVPDIGIILGSGLGDLADQIEDAIRIPFEEIPHFPRPTIEGHAGQFILGRLEGKNVVTMKGRIHYYEGYSIQQVTFPVRLMKNLGIKIFIVTNASGGVNQSFSAGDLMLITDHINMQGTNPLIGPNDPEVGPRFPDMSEAYTRSLVKLAEEIAMKEGIPVRKGIFTAVTGPNYETIAEIKFLRIIGVDAVGMSTVPEVLVARHAGLKVLGISCITDVVHTDEGVTPVSHEEVLAVANRVKPRFIRLMRSIVREIDVQE